MPEVRVIPFSGLLNPEHLQERVNFTEIAMKIAEHHGFTVNRHSMLISGVVGESIIYQFHFDEVPMRAVFRFAPFALGNGYSRELVSSELMRFQDYAVALKNATGYSIDIEKPLSYDE